MLAGEPFSVRDPEVYASKLHAVERCQRLNEIPVTDTGEKEKAIYDIRKNKNKSFEKYKIKIKKHIFIDPSIGLAALGISPEYFYNDLDLFGHAFENLVLRDLLAYAEAEDARVMHYSDDMGMEADAVYQLSDGRYALIEVKTGANAIPAAEIGLLKFKNVIHKHNEEALADEEHPGVMYREPDLLIIICAHAPMAYTTENGVKVIPFGCLRD